MQIKLNQDNIKKEDIPLAIAVRNYITANNWVIGNPALGLKKTLKELEAKKAERDVSDTDWLVDDSELEQDIALTKAGIVGEERLSEYLSKLLKLDDDLFGIAAFASLAYGEPDPSLDYIPDTDTILVYGKHVLILDAKNLKTKPKEEIFLEGTTVLNAKGKEIISFNSSVNFWRGVFKEANIEIDSIIGFVCVVNNIETNIIKDDNWFAAPVKLIHISELKELLKRWVKGKDNTIRLNILTEIAKAQVKEEKDTKVNTNLFKQQFGV